MLGVSEAGKKPPMMYSSVLIAFGGYLHFTTVSKHTNTKWLQHVWHHYRPQRSCGKVMFSQASVILSGGVYGRQPPGKHPPGRIPPGRHPSWADTSPRQTPPHPVHAGIHTPYLVHAGIHIPCPVHAGIHAPLQRPLQRTVRILLECILVIEISWHKSYSSQFNICIRQISLGWQCILLICPIYQNVS